MRVKLAQIVSLQNASQEKNRPLAKDFQHWVYLTLQHQNILNSYVHIRLVDKEESASLNQQYRKKIGPTNILSFPFDVPPGVPSDLLGDLIMCVPLIIEQAHELQKFLSAYWAHLTIHGTLHLLGFDHINECDAQKMEAVEIYLLTKLGYGNPYLTLD